MKMTAEMKFTNAILSNRFLEWSPDGSLLAVADRDRGLYLLAFEDLPPVTGGKTPRVRRQLRITAQCPLPSPAVAATFAQIPFRLCPDGLPQNVTTGLAATLFEDATPSLPPQQQLTCLLLYVSQDNGKLTVTNLFF